MSSLSPPAYLTEEEKARCRYHLGYFSLQAAPSIQLGFPRASQPLFLVNLSFNQLTVYDIGLVRERIAILDGIEQRMLDAMERFQAKKLGEITLRDNPEDNEIDMLEKEYRRWALRLADVLGVPLNIYSERFRPGAAGGPQPLNIAVRH